MVPIRGSDLSACDGGVLAGFGHGETGSESPAHGIRNHIFLFLFFPPQACPRLSIFSATSPQQTETAHASLHARDPAQPYNARIFRRLDASKCFSLPPGLAPFGQVKEKLTGKKMAPSGWRVDLCANWPWVPNCPSVGTLLAFCPPVISLWGVSPSSYLWQSKFATSREWNLFRNTEFYDRSKVYSLGYLQSVIKLTVSNLARTQSNNNNKNNNDT